MIISTADKAGLFAAIDPSINDVGITFLNRDGSYNSSMKFSPEEKNDATVKLESLASQLIRLFSGRREEFREVLIEHTRFFARDVRKSHPSAQKLNLVKGMIYGVCRALLSCPVHMVWISGFSKGQAELISKAFGLPEGISQHEKDAFWLGNTWAVAPEFKRQAFLEKSRTL